MLTEQVPQRGACHPGDDRRHGVHDRLEEQRLFRLVAAGAQHGRTILPGFRLEVRCESRLADPRFPGDHDQARIADHGAGPGLAQHPDLRVPPGQPWPWRDGGVTGRASGSSRGRPTGR
jgi:hypothetical protein